MHILCSLIERPLVAENIYSVCLSDIRLRTIKIMFSLIVSHSFATSSVPQYVEEEKSDSAHANHHHLIE